MAMIKFDHVDKYYGKFHALKNINLEFEKGRARCFAVSMD